MLGLNTLSAEVFKTPNFRVLALKPLLKRANRDVVDVTVLCLESFLFLVLDSFDASLEVDAFAVEVELDEWLFE